MGWVNFCQAFRENKKSSGGFARPRLSNLGRWRTIERVVDLTGVKDLRVVFEFTKTLCLFFRIESAVPPLRRMAGIRIPDVPILMSFAGLRTIVRSHAQRPKRPHFEPGETNPFRPLATNQLIACKISHNEGSKDTIARRLEDTHASQPNETVLPRQFILTFAPFCVTTALHTTGLDLSAGAFSRVSF